MIISASRRTDIPCFYSEWLLNRIKEGYVYVRNPMNIHHISKIELNPGVVDGIVFWTKNPIPIMKYIDKLSTYNFYFQFTLNSYGTDIEKNIPSKNDVIIPAFKELSKRIGKDKVIWRYDPIIFTEKYNLTYHIKYFEILASKLGDYTEKCTVSFLDLYNKTKRNMKNLNIYSPSLTAKFDLMGNFSDIAKKYGLYVDTCAEDIDLRKFGIKHAHCIDKERFERLTGYRLLLKKDKNQRTECGCVASIDIGAYNTCRNLCSYCYANYNEVKVIANSKKHNPKSPLLFGKLKENDIVKERDVKSCKECTLNLFK